MRMLKGSIVRSLNRIGLPQKTLGAKIFAVQMSQTWGR